MEIENVLEYYGDWAHGGDIEGAADRWRNEGFSNPDTVSEWLANDVWCPVAARKFLEGGLIPMEIGGMIEYSEGISVGYAVSNGDYSVEDALRQYTNEQNFWDGLSQEFGEGIYEIDW